MAVNQTILSECFVFFYGRSTNLLFILSEEGKIIDANNYAGKFTGKDLVGSYFCDLCIHLSDNFEIYPLLSDPSKEYIINISSSSNLPQSFYFTFKKVPGFILAFGRRDAEELDAMQKEILDFSNEVNNLNRELNKKNAQLKDAFNHIKTLQGILPICMHCHQIRNDQQMWEKLESYLSEHSEVKFSHSICPECAEKYYPDMDLYGD